jgi:hypothetical protein
MVPAESSTVSAATAAPAAAPAATEPDVAQARPTGPMSGDVGPYTKITDVMVRADHETWCYHCPFELTGSTLSPAGRMDHVAGARRTGWS